jgi:hypothetical protein
MHGCYLNLVPTKIVRIDSTRTRNLWPCYKSSKNKHAMCGQSGVSSRYLQLVGLERTIDSANSSSPEENAQTLQLLNLIPAYALDNKHPPRGWKDSCPVTRMRSFHRPALCLRRWLNRPRSKLLWLQSTICTLTMHSRECHCIITDWY